MLVLARDLVSRSEDSGAGRSHHVKSHHDIPFSSTIISHFFLANFMFCYGSEEILFLKVTFRGTRVSGAR